MKKHVSKIMSCAAALVLGMSVSGCNTLQFGVAQDYRNNDVGQRYQNTVEIFGQQKMSFGQYAAKETPSLYYVCKALFKTRDFSEFLRCRDSFNRFVGDNVAYSGRKVMLDNFYGEYLIAIAKYQQAYDLLLNAHAKSLKNKELEPSLIEKMAAADDLGETEALAAGPMDTVRSLLVAAKLSGNKEGFAAAIERSKSLQEEFRERTQIVKGFEMMEIQVRSTLAQISIAQNDFEAAYAEMSSPSEVGVGTVYSAISFLTGSTLLRDAIGAMDMPEFNFNNMYAYSAYMTKRYDVAKEKYTELLRSPIFSQQKNANFHVYQHLGMIALHENKPSEAIEYLKNAVTALEEERSTINSEAAKIGFVGDKQEVYQDLISVLLSSGRDEEAFEYVERAKARALVDMLAQRKDFGSPSSAGMLEELEKLELASLSATGANANGSKVRKVSADDLKGEIRSTSKELSSLVMVSATKASDIQKQLKSDEVLLEYFGSGDELYAFVVTRSSVKAKKLTGQRLNEEVSAFRQSLEAYPSKSYERISQSLYNRLIAPVAPLLKGNKLTVVAHGALHYLPFAALSDGRAYLVDKFAMRSLPSASVLSFLNKPAKASNDLLAFGNPDLGNPDYDLPGAQNETQVINRGWKGAKVLLREHASEENFKKYASGFKYLHLASHGEFNASEPLKSRMLLAPSATEDGNLTVDELYTMNLNADLVTLSACETGLGDIVNGDDVIGLNRGFLYAGAKSIVSSLWAVSDEATADLMKNFYANLKTMQKDAALRKAMLTTKARYPHPVFWAAFQMTGGV